MKPGLLNNRSLSGDGLRFAVMGFANTAFTLMIYQLLMFVMQPLPSYYLSWAVGLVVLLFAFPAYVFKGARGGPGRGLAIIAIYLISLVLGGWLLTQVEAHGVNPRSAILFVIALTTVFNFTASRLIFRFSDRLFLQKSA